MDLFKDILRTFSTKKDKISKAFTIKEDIPALLFSLYTWLPNPIIKVLKQAVLETWIANPQIIYVSDSTQIVIILALETIKEASILLEANHQMKVTYFIRLYHINLRISSLEDFLVQG